MATKKKKVETPIDHRETFVSLQKNFTDSEVPIEEKLKTLYDLQQADRAIDDLILRRGELPSEVEAIEDDLAMVKAGQTKITALIDEYTNKIALDKQSIVDCDAQTDKLRAELDTISNSREFDTINKEIENQGYLRQIAEKDINELRLKIDEKKAELEDVKESIAVKTADLKAKKKELDDVVKSTADEEKSLRDRREECASRIDERVMSAYERIRASVHNHLAVVSVYNGNACGGCFNAITPQRLIDIASGKKLIICEHCGRIIVNYGSEEKKED